MGLPFADILDYTQLLRVDDGDFHYGRSWQGFFPAGQRQGDPDLSHLGFRWDSHGAHQLAASSAIRLESAAYRDRLGLVILVGERGFDDDALVGSPQNVTRLVGSEGSLTHTGSPHDCAQ